MYFLALLGLFVLMAAVMPKTWAVIKFLVIAPIVGVAVGGFTWAIAAMFCGALITWAAFGTFLAAGTVLAEVLLAKAD